MRIDRLEIQNFKKFEHLDITFHPQFTLLIGENGSGKTSVLDALAVALGIWHKAVPGSGTRNIAPSEIRLESFLAGERKAFKQQFPVKITATGNINYGEKTWTRMIRKDSPKTINVDCKDIIKNISDSLNINTSDGFWPKRPFPILAYYGAGRGLSIHGRYKYSKISTDFHGFSLLSPYYKCLESKIGEKDVNNWFLIEAAAAGNRGGRFRPGFETVRHAILGAIPDAHDLYFDADINEIILNIDKISQPFSNLSAGQRTMLVMVADMAIRAIILNSYIYNQPHEKEFKKPEALLERIQGIVFIDELDVHLHPRWQRQVAANLKKIFPKIQFICTSHSPQIIGELQPEEIRLLVDDKAYIPPRSFGIDSNRILEEIMDSSARSEGASKLLNKLSNLIYEEKLDEAKKILKKIENILGSNDPEINGARTLISFLEAPL